MFRQLFCERKLQNFTKVNVSGLDEFLSLKNGILNVFHIMEENNENMAYRLNVYIKNVYLIENLRQDYIRNIGLSYLFLNAFELDMAYVFSNGNKLQVVSIFLR